MVSPSSLRTPIAPARASAARHALGQDRVEHLLRRDRLRQQLRDALESSRSVGCVAALGRGHRSWSEEISRVSWSRSPRSMRTSSARRSRRSSPGRTASRRSRHRRAARRAACRPARRARSGTRSGCRASPRRQPARARPSSRRLRHHHVEQHEVGPFSRASSSALATVGGLEHVHPGGERFTRQSSRIARSSSTTRRAARCPRLGLAVPRPAERGRAHAAGLATPRPPPPDGDPPPAKRSRANRMRYLGSHSGTSNSRCVAGC